MGNYFSHEKLWKLIRARGLESRDIARQIGMSETAFSQILNGRTKNPHKTNIEKIATALGITASDLAPDEATDQDEARLLRCYRLVVASGNEDARLKLLGMALSLADEVATGMQAASETGSAEPDRAVEEAREALRRPPGPRRKKADAG